MRLEKLAVLGNNFPQASAEPRLGNLQLEYSFAPISPFTTSPSRNPWENTLTPEKLREAVAVLGVDPQTWDIPCSRSQCQHDRLAAAVQNRWLASGPTPSTCSQPHQWVTGQWR